jgi:DHA2 family methylenomycin A resistance protein-like MFS transporter
VGWWAACGGISLAAGPVLGGLLVTQIGWRSIFLINLPIGLLGVYLTLRYVAPHGGSHRRSLDWGGQVAAIAALAALSMALTEAGPLGWTHSVVLAGLLVAGVAALSFVWIEARSRSPMVPLTLFRIPTFAVVSVAGVVVNFAYYGLIFVFSLFFQIQQQRSSQLTGLAFLPMTLVLIGGNVLAGRLISKLGARKLMVLGLVLAALGYLLLLPVTIAGSYWSLVVPMVVAATGIALMVPTMTNATLASVDASRAGIAAGVLNTARQVGGLLGVAVFGYLIADTTAQAFMRGMHISLGISVVLLLSTSLLCWRSIHPDSHRPEPHTGSRCDLEASCSKG